MELCEGRSKEKILVSQTDANKKVEVNEAFAAEWQKRKCL